MEKKIKQKKGTTFFSCFIFQSSEIQISQYIISFYSLFVFYSILYKAGTKCAQVSHGAREAV